MKLLFSIALIFAFAGIAVSQAVRHDQKTFSYHVEGIVIDENSRPMANVLICFTPAERPIGGRIPCVRTNSKGNFGIGANDIPDKYIVIASTGDSVLSLAGDEEKGIRFKSSEIMEFGAKDESREITIQFEAMPPKR